MSTPKVTELLETRIALSYKEFGSLIGLSSGGIRQQVARGALSFTRVGGRRLIPIGEVRRILGINDTDTESNTAA